MLSIDIRILEDGLPVDGDSQGYIAIKGEHGEIINKGSVRVFMSLTYLLDGVRKFVLEKKQKQQLSIGIDSWLEPYLVRTQKNFSFLDDSKKIVSKSSELELTSTVLSAVEDFYNEYAPLISTDDSAMIDLRDALVRFRSAFPQAKLLSDR